MGGSDAEAAAVLCCAFDSQYTLLSYARCRDHFCPCPRPRVCVCLFCCSLCRVSCETDGVLMYVPPARRNFEGYYYSLTRPFFVVPTGDREGKGGAG